MRRLTRILISLLLLSLSSMAQDFLASGGRGVGNSILFREDFETGTLANWTGTTVQSILIENSKHPAVGSNSVLQSAISGTFSAGSTTTALAYSGNVTAGSTLVIGWRSGFTAGTCAVSSATDTLGNSWQAVFSHKHGTVSVISGTLYSPVIKAGGANTVTLTWSNASDCTGQIQTVIEYTGPNEQHSFKSVDPANGTSFSPGAVTTGGDAGIILGLITTLPSGSRTLAGNTPSFTVEQTTPSISALGLEDRLFSTSESDTASWTITGSATDATVSPVVLKAAGASYNGSWSGHMHYTASATSSDLHFDKTFSGGVTKFAVRFRFLRHVNSGGTYNPTNLKLFEWRSDNTNGCAGGTDLIIVIYLSNDGTHADPALSKQVSSYAAGTCVKTDVWIGPTTTLATAVSDVWHTVELDFNTNTFGVADGSATLYMDGILAETKTAVDWRLGNNELFKYFQAGHQVNCAGTCDEDRYLDNLLILNSTTQSYGGGPIGGPGYPQIP